MAINKKQLLELHQAYINVFKTESGKKLLADLESSCYNTQSTFPSSNDPYRLAFNEGKRSVLVRIKNLSDPANIARFEEINKRNQNNNIY